MEGCKKGGVVGISEADCGTVHSQCGNRAGEMAKCQECKKSKQQSDEPTGDDGQRAGDSQT